MQSDTLDPPVTRTMLLVRLAGVLVLAVPVAVLALAMVRVGGSPQPILAGGMATCAFLALGLLHQIGSARAISHKSASPLYLIAVLILWMNTRDYHNWFIQAAMGTLLGVPLSLFVLQEYLFTGRSSLRRARYFARRLSNRTDWPENLVECKNLPEVKALREAIHDDAEPVLVLLMHPRPQVRIAALAALDFRPAWRKGEAETVLQAAKFATEPPVRAAALTALANVDDPTLLAAIAVYLRDATPEVRQAAAEALLWDADGRWGQIRRQIRLALADPRCLGPLPCAGSLPNQATVDLTMWSGEQGPIGVRATLTLLAHYRRELNENPGSQVVEQLVAQAADNKVPSSLRVELANLLVEEDGVDPRLWNELLEAGQPSALRLLAAGALLRNGPDEKAVEALRDVARVPNREIAVQVAAIIQRYLRIDMGLPLGGPLPDPTSKQAAELARSVMDWASGKPVSPGEHHSTRRKRLTTMLRQIPRPEDDKPRRRT